MDLQDFEFETIHEPGITNIADVFSRLVTETDTGKTYDVIKWVTETMRPQTIQKDELDEASKDDEDFKLIREALATDMWGNVPIAYQHPEVKGQLLTCGNLILRGDRIVIPCKLRQHTIDLAHVAHQGATAMKAHLRSRVWFPQLDDMVKDTIKKCKYCAMMSRPPVPGLMTRRLSTLPWQDIALDFKEALPGGESLLVVVCYMSRYIQVEPMTNPTSRKVILALLKMFSLFGIPRSIRADNGPQFRSSEFQKFCRDYGIELNLSTPYWPQANGSVERQNENIGKRIKISVAQGTDWKSDLYEYLTFYHSTPQDTTGMSPSAIMLGRELPNLLPSIKISNQIRLENATEKDFEYKHRKKMYADEKRRAKPNDLKIGDTVLRKNLKMGANQPNFEEEEFEVTDTMGNEVQITSKDSGTQYWRNKTHLKRYGPSQNEAQEKSQEGEEMAESNTRIESDVDEANKEMAETHESAIKKQTETGRPQRKRQAPKALQDYYH